MCVGPLALIGSGPQQPKPAAQQTSDGVAQAAPAVWRLLAEKGGMMGAVAKAKLKELDSPQPQYPTIPLSGK